MPQEEVTEKRPTNYSRWHRAKLPGWCFMTDGDWFEQRKIGGKLRAVAYIETIEVKSPSVVEAQIYFRVWFSKKALLEDIHERMGIPSFIVWHNPTCTEFLIQRSPVENPPKRMNEKEYMEFIRNLGKS